MRTAGPRTRLPAEHNRERQGAPDFRTAARRRREPWPLPPGGRFRRGERAGRPSGGTTERVGRATRLARGVTGLCIALLGVVVLLAALTMARGPRERAHLAGALASVGALVVGVATLLMAVAGSIFPGPDRLHFVALTVGAVAGLAFCAVPLWSVCSCAVGEVCGACGPLPCNGQNRSSAGRAPRANPRPYGRTGRGRLARRRGALGSPLQAGRRTSSCPPCRSPAASLVVLALGR